MSQSRLFFFSTRATRVSFLASLLARLLVSYLTYLPITYHQQADTGEGISVCLVLRLEETLRPAYRRIHIEEAWRLVSMLGESDDERGPEAQVRRGLEASDEVLSSVQVSADRNMMLVGRVERGTGAKKVFMFVSELRREDDEDGEDDQDDQDDEDGDRGCFRWCLASVDALS